MSYMAMSWKPHACFSNNTIPLTWLSFPVGDDIMCIACISIVLSCCSVWYLLSQEVLVEGP